MTTVWVITTTDTFGRRSITAAFDNEVAAEEYARNAWGASVDEVDVRSDCPPWAKDMKQVMP